MFSCVRVLLTQCPALCWTMPLQRIWQRYEKREKMIGQCFQYFCIGVFLIISCFTYDQLFVGRCHFKDFWSEGSRKRGREWGFHLLCQVRLESMSKRGEVDILMTTKWILGLLEKYLLKLGNWVIEFWFELEKYFSLHKKKFRVFLCCLSVSPEYFGLDAFESSQRHERPHQSLFNISDRFCFTKPFYS